MNIDKSFSVLCSFGMLSNQQVSPTDLRVYLYIKFRWQFFQTKTGEFHESAKTIADYLHISEKTVRRSLEKLQALGYLEIAHRQGKTSLYIPKDESLTK